MSLLLFALPALVFAQAPAAPGALEPMQELLKAIPAALIEGKRSSMPGLVAKAKAAWEKAQPEARKTMPEPDVAFIGKQLQAMLKMKPAEQGIGALGISATLSRFQAKSRKQDLLQANRAAMSAWCGVDAGVWQPMPNVAQAFKPLLDQDQGQHTMAALAVQDALKRFQASQPKRQTAVAKKALKDLVALVDVLEKP